MKHWRTGNFKTCSGTMLVLALLGGMLLSAWGCSRPVARGIGREDAGRFLATVRPVSTEPARLLRNAHYFRIMGRPDLALKELEEAYAVDPGNLKVINGLGQTYEALGDYARARQIYQEALSRHQGHRALANNLCFLYYQEAKLAEAEACFKQTLARDPQNAAARNNLGLLYCRLGKEDEAYRLWKDAGGEVAAQGMMQQAMVALGKKTDYARTAPAAAPPLAARPATPAALAAAGVSGPLVDQPETQLESPEVRAAKIAAATAPGPDQPAMTSKTDRAAAIAPAPAASPAPAVSPPKTEAVEKTPPTRVAASPRLSVPQVQGPAAPPESPAAKPDEPVKPSAAEVKPAAPVLSAQPPAAVAASGNMAQPNGVSEAGQAAVPAPATKPAPKLTAQELGSTRLLVLNGAGIKKLARRVRSILSKDGYYVGRIGNHIDFGAERTVIYYLPESERVAQALSAAHFPQSTLAPRAKLPRGAAVKIVLGKELAALDLMAGLRP